MIARDEKLAAAEEPYLLPGLASLTPVGGRIYSPSWRGRYPHLMPLDVAIWDRFLSEFGKDFLGFQYDILLGTGAAPLDNMSADDKLLLYALTVKRADVLMIQSDKLWLVELKPRLGMAAVGQLVSYKYLWERQYGYHPPVLPTWIGEQNENDLSFVMEQLGFTSIIV
jgi:hypothetical protein